MALGLGSNAAQNVFNAEFRAATFTAPAAWWIKFHTGDPGPSGTANAAANTTRYQATFTATTVFGALAAVANSALITLTSVPNTETYSHFSLWTASSGGSLVVTGTVTGSVTAGQSPTIPAGALTITVNVGA